MTTPAEHAVAIVGVGAILPDAPDAAAFWRNVTGGRYSISEVDAERWDPSLYYDPDPKAPDRTYSKIGGWVRDYEWEPLAWHLPVPPKVSDAIDAAQQWAVACTRMALRDAGWPERPLDLERTAVVLGNAMAGEHHYLTALRLAFPEIARELDSSPSFATLPEAQREAIAGELHANMDGLLPAVTEDTMPGELGNCLAGRIANLFNMRGPNFVVDAACASAMAAMDASIEGLVEGEFDAVVTGGIDRNMGAATFIKFCAIGALSGSGTRPYDEGADGFVMGEGAALFVLKRLADAERDGDRVYAVVRGIAGSSDGKGKGITAPNPIGQRLAVQRAWAKSGLTPDACSLIEGHGTSTRVGDAVELESLGEAFGGAGLQPGSIALGSVKSNIGHLKGAAGAAGLLKATLALHHKVLPPSLHFDRPNPNLDWSASPFTVNTELRDWTPHDGEPRVAGVSAFGFGGTNFHAVLEEHVPGRFSTNGHASISVPATAGTPNDRSAAAPPAGASSVKPPLRGALVVGAADDSALAERLRAALAAPPPATPTAPDPADVAAPVRVAIDFADADDRAAKGALALKALEGGNPAAWKALRARGIFHGAGPARKIAFLYTGQGSQYANMLGELRRTEPIVAETFAEADRIMRPLLDGRALSDVIFVDPADADAVAVAEAELRRTEITQPAVLAVDMALTRLLAAYGITPDFVMGHSLGEYGALVAAGVLSFGDALEAVSARGSEMASLKLDDPGAMAAISAPREEVDEIVAQTDGYVVLANVNSDHQVVLGGATEPVLEVARKLAERGHQAIPLPVSHAFHTEIVAPASEPLRTMLRRLRLGAPRIPVVANVDGEFYPTGDGVEEQIVEILGRQVASPVQFVRGLHTLYGAGARVFVEVGPKRALHGFVEDVLATVHDDVLALFTNHPKVGDIASVNQALCGLYAAGLGYDAPVTTSTSAAVAAPAPAVPTSTTTSGKVMPE
ncbi:MAG TPA: beta-ketoacyl synthase N-terminal-like domain-containing protein, partial [Solirubrobacteraceae bacterium]|nr:beta-ketoacyl synthase N-terminal-like domain-containing protein [Solirubrobacteraceae bacterium]